MGEVSERYEAGSLTDLACPHTGSPPPKMSSTAPLPSPKQWPALRAPYDWQPLKALFITSCILKAVVLSPIWAVQHAVGLSPFPSSYSIKEALVTRTFHALWPIVPGCAHHIDVLDYASGRVTPDTLNKKGFKQTRAQWIHPPGDQSRWYRGIALEPGCEPARVAGVFWAKTDKPVADLVVKEEEVVLLNMHGGGLAMGNATERDITAEFARQVLARSSPIAHVLTPDYRKVNTAPFPAQLVDTITAYACLVDTLGVDPSRIVVSGDSAGGLLALMLVRYLRDELRVKQLPRALVLSSPLCDTSYWVGPKMELHPSPNRHIDFLNIRVVST